MSLRFDAVLGGVFLIWTAPCVSPPVDLFAAAQEVPATQEVELREPEAEPPFRPQTRKEYLESLRKERAARLAPVRRTPLEKYFLGFDRKGNETLQDSSFKGFYPRLAFIGRGSGIAAGARYWKPEALGSLDVLASAFYSNRGYQFFDLQFGIIPNRGQRIPPSSMEEEEIDHLGEVERARFSRFRLYGSARYRHSPEVAYFGTGADSDLAGEANFRHRDTRFQITTGYQLTPRLAWTVTTGYVRNSLGPGLDSNSPSIEEVYSPDELPGFDDPPGYLTLGSQVVADLRDDPGIPRSGLLAAFGWQKWNDIDPQNHYNFSVWGGDVRGYIPLDSRQQVLALRVFGAFLNPTDFNEVPFFLKPSQGSGSGLRGFRSHRFRGDKTVRLQLEYRWLPSRRVELAVFGDSATVADNGVRLSFSELKSDFGVGLRIRSSTSTILRIDQAWSNEESRTIVRFESAF